MISVLSLNIRSGAHLDGRWAGLADLITGVAPTILLLQACKGWLDDDLCHIAATERRLGMRVLIGPPGSSSTGYHTAVAYDPGRLVWAGTETRYSHLTEHGYVAARFELEGFDGPLVAMSVHLTPYSADRAAQEAQMLITRAYKYDGVALIGGVLNHPPGGDPEPDWLGEVSPYNRASRVLPYRTGEPIRANTAVGDVLRTAEMTDVAAHLADRRGDPSLRLPTHPASGVRLDQIWVTPALAGEDGQAISDYARVGTGDLSDHDSVLAVLDETRGSPTRTIPYA